MIVFKVRVGKMAQQIKAAKLAALSWMSGTLLLVVF